MEDYYTNLTEHSPIMAKNSEQSSKLSPQLQHLASPRAYLQPHANANQYKYNKDSFNIDFKDILKRIVKYLVEGLAVAFVAYYFIGKGRFNIKDIVYLGITAAFVFAILDTFAPTVSLGARFGAGFGIGQGLFGLNPVLINPVVPVV